MGLFSDMLPEVSMDDGAPEEPTTVGPNPPLSQPSSSSVTGSLSGLMEDTAVEEPAQAQTPLLPPPLPPRALPATPAAPEAQAARDATLPPISEPKTVDPNEGLAIGKSGYLLAQEGPEAAPGRAGQARIVTDGQAPVPGRTPPGSSAGGKAGTKPKAGSGGSSGSGTAKPKGKPRAVVKPNLSVILVNETGVPGAENAYHQVLSQIGYNIVSSSQGVPTGGPGSKTTIVYQAGQAAQARALASRIPGEKELVASKEPLPAGAIVTIR
jgi:hypothetical protein